MRHALLLSLLAAPLFAAAPATAPSPASAPAQPAENTVRWLRDNFAAPPAAYSTMPFLVWNGEVTEQEIDRHLQAFKDQGIRGFFIHPRYGLITEYLSPRWFDLIAYTVKRARELGMQAWLYDENSFPSGFAGGHVNEQMPASWNEGQGLHPVFQTRLQPDAQKRYAAILYRSTNDWFDITARAAESIGKPGYYTLYEITSYPRSAWNGGWSYVDLIHPGVTEKFLDVTMSGYERAIGPSLSHVQLSVIAPVRGTRPYVGRSPVTPQRIDGLTMLPWVSLPIANPASPAATAAPGPALEPDDPSSSSHGFFVSPPNHTSFSASEPRLSFATSTAPASFSRAVTVASFAGTRSRYGSAP